MPQGEGNDVTSSLLEHYNTAELEMERLSSSEQSPGWISKAHDDKRERVTANVVNASTSASPSNSRNDHYYDYDGNADEVVSEDGDREHPEQYKLYKRRFFGLAQLVLLNIVVYWAGLTFAAVSATSADFFDVSQTAINWLSTAYLFAFVATAPFVIWTLNKGGPKISIIVASTLILVGNWIRYAGSRSSNVKSRFPVVMVGQILLGVAQPFILSAPTRYSNLWFSDSGRVTATAVASLANPLGGALGQLIGPFWAASSGQVPNMILYTCIISTVASVPSFFIPSAPPTPPSKIAAAEKLDLRSALRILPQNASFWLILIPFGVYVGFFNATAALVNQIFEPYGFSETDAGIAGALLIVVGLVASAIVSPLVDRSGKHLLTIKILVPIIASGYLILIFMPQTRSIAGPYVVMSVLGASSFSLLPCVLEYLVLVTHPVSPEISSTICWSSGQLLGAIFIIVMGQLKGGVEGQPKESLKRGLIFQAVISWVALPSALLIGVGRFKRRNNGSDFGGNG